VGHTEESPKQLCARVLKMEPKWAAILVAEEFTTLEEIAYVPIDEFREIKRIDEQQIQIWRAHARKHLLIQTTSRGDDDETALPSVTDKPQKLLSDGSGATIDQEEDERK
jgi:transcription termination/antitermination protein NusA